MKRKPFVFIENDIAYIKAYSVSLSDREIGLKLNVGHWKVKMERYNQGLFKKIGRKAKLSKYALAMEDYMANGLPMHKIAKKHGIHEVDVSRYAKKMFFLKLNENTKLITLRSKL